MASIGIDFGNNFTRAAIFNNGKYEILASIPSIISFTDDEIIIGETVKTQLFKNPKNTIFDFKRFIGITFEEYENMNIKYVPYTIINEKNRPCFKIETKKKIKIFTPEDIAIMILCKIINDVEKILGNIKQIVLTIPIYFNMLQRKAMLDICKATKHNIINIMNDQTAIVLYHETFEDLEVDNKNILVFDLGGGSFSCSIINVNGKKYEIISSGGDSIGGCDITNILVNFILQYIETTDILSIQLIKKECEHVKKSLSSVNLQVFEIYDFFEKDLCINVTVKKFNNLINKISNKILNIVEQVINDSKLITDDIYKIIYTGGSSKIRSIKNLVIESYLDAKNFTFYDYSEDVVAAGASIYAHIYGNENIFIPSQLPYSIGIKTFDKGVFNILLKNSILPSKSIGKKTFATVSDNQETIILKIIEGKNKHIGSIVISDIPILPKNILLINIKFLVYINGYLYVNVTIEDTSKKEILFYNNRVKPASSSKNYSPPDDKIIEELPNCYKEHERLKENYFIFEKMKCNIINLVCLNNNDEIIKFHTLKDDAIKYIKLLTNLNLRKLVSCEFTKFKKETVDKQKHLLNNIDLMELHNFYVGKKEEIEKTELNPSEFIKNFNIKINELFMEIKKNKTQY